MSELIDPFNRSIHYLRVSVTDRCNYRCFYCMPSRGLEWEQRKEFLSYEELTRLIRLFSELGVDKVRLTGGEPLARRGILEFVRQLSKLPGINDLSMSTNAHLLANQAQALAEAGIQRVNISLDSLDPGVFRQITRNGELQPVLRGIDAALEAGMHPVKINMVVMKGLNELEIEPMLDYALERGADLRYIETMPIGEAGIQGADHYFPADRILFRLKRHLGSDLIPVKGARGAGPARYYQVSAGPVRVGVIGALSRHFCDDCNRVRLTARGDLVLCLGQEDRESLREPMRRGATDNEIKELILLAIARKPLSHEFNTDESRVSLRHMSSLGG
ncbi:MAG: GTP 3',8-cyclase MoaA [Gammaproteobacteria bacterium]|nr:GTP 3',8-cyclase MoaA [Gammaproteobacteria bacterium]